MKTTTKIGNLAICVVVFLTLYFMYSMAIDALFDETPYSQDGAR